MQFSQSFSSSFFLLFVFCCCRVQSQDAQFWNDQAQDTLQKALTRERTLNRNVAKNIVYFVGDGMGVSTVTAGRILKGQQMGMTGEENVLSWESFSSVGLSKTYNTDSQVADSAGTGTAYFCGVKTRRGAVGVDESVHLNDCNSSIGAEVQSVMIDAQMAGKATGFVTTTRVTHAAPACLYAHSPQRHWENSVPADQAQCKDIALQLIELGADTQVIMGGGRLTMLPNTVNDPELVNLTGLRSDGRNLIDEWKASKPPSSSRYVWNLTEFNEVDPNTTDYLMGLFEYSHMQFEADRADDIAGEPSLAEMVEKAIKILQKDEDGFFLMVEGGRIDHGHHYGIAYKALEDTIALDAAVAKAMELTNEEDTLVIVTADHSHGMTIGGYPSRGNPILGLSGSYLGNDKIPFTTLAYANGEGGIEEWTSYTDTGLRRNLTNDQTGVPTFKQSAIVPLNLETHSGEDVAIYANGPMSHLFHGVHEQNYLAHVVRYAACIGGSTDHCDSYEPPCGGASTPASSNGIDMLACVVAALTWSGFLH